VPAKFPCQITLDGSPLIICGDFNATHSAPSQEYIRARSELETTQSQNQLQPGNTIENLLNELNALDRRSQDDSYMAWKAGLSSLPVPKDLRS
jgi:endonuclease/exonuclease/phosphatase family metal-dependent hydrolase